MPMDMETARKVLAGIIPADPETMREANALYYGSGTGTQGSYANLTQAQRPSIPAGPGLSNFTPSFEPNPTGYDQFGRPTSYNPDYYATQKTAEEVARLLGGRLVYNPGVTEGPFTIPGNYEVEINGRRYNAGQLARMLQAEQVTYNQAARDYELNRQLNPNLFTKGPGFHTIVDPATAVLNRLQAEIEQERRWEEAARARDAATPTGPSYSPGPATPAAPATPTQPAQGPMVTRTWYEFYRRNRPLDPGQARQVEDSSPWALAGLNNQVINEQGMGVPLGSPGALISRVTATGPFAGNGPQAPVGTGPGTWPLPNAPGAEPWFWPNVAYPQDRPYNWGMTMAPWPTPSSPGTDPWLWHSVNRDRAIRRSLPPGMAMDNAIRLDPWSWGPSPSFWPQQEYATPSAPGTEPWLWQKGGPVTVETGPPAQRVIDWDEAGAMTKRMFEELNKMPPESLRNYTTDNTVPYWNNSNSRVFTGSWGPMGPGPRPTRNQPGWLMPLTSGPSTGRQISNYSTRYNPGSGLTF